MQLLPGDLTCTFNPNSWLERMCVSVMSRPGSQGMARRCHHYHNGMVFNRGQDSFVLNVGSPRAKIIPFVDEVSFRTEYRQSICIIRPSWLRNCSDHGLVWSWQHSISSMCELLNRQPYPSLDIWLLAKRFLNLSEYLPFLTEQKWERYCTQSCCDMYRFNAAYPWLPSELSTDLPCAIHIEKAIAAGYFDLVYENRTGLFAEMKGIA